MAQTSTMQGVCLTILLTLVVSGFALPTKRNSNYPWISSGKFEGDILLQPEQDGKHGMTDVTKRWPNGIMYYQFEHSLTEFEREVFQEAINEYHERTCVKIEERTDQENYVEIGKWEREGCFSEIGMRGERQVMNIGGCYSHGALVHEIMHAFGFWHQHCDPKRDDYIDILWDNIIFEEREQFEKYNETVATDFGVGYDYGSIMHYPREAFSIDEKRLDTIVPKDPDAEIGQREKLSDKDILKLNRMYDCDLK